MSSLLVGISPLCVLLSSLCVVMSSKLSAALLELLYWLTYSEWWWYTLKPGARSLVLGESSIWKWSSSVVILMWRSEDKLLRRLCWRWASRSDERETPSLSLLWNTTGRITSNSATRQNKTMRQFTHLSPYKVTIDMFLWHFMGVSGVTKIIRIIYSTFATSEIKLKDNMVDEVLNLWCLSVYRSKGPTCLLP